MFGSQERADAALRPLTEGKALKAKGQGKVLAAEEVWGERAMLWIRSLSPGYLFSSDDLCDAVGRPRHPNAVGAILTAACRSKRIERYLYAQSTRPARRGGLIRIWRVI